MLNLIIKYPILALIAIVAVIFLLGWADNGGVEQFHNGLTDQIAEVSGANDLSDKIRNPFG